MKRTGHRTLVHASAAVVAIAFGAQPHPRLSSSELRRDFPARAARILDGPNRASWRGDEARLESASGAALRVSADGRALQLSLPNRATIAIEEPIPAGATVLVDGSAVIIASREASRFWTAGADGLEEWLRVESLMPGQPISRWRVPGAFARGSGQRVELRDTEGEALLEVTAPRAFASDGRAVPLRLEAHGAEVTLFAAVEAPLPGPVLVDPTWSPTATPMSTGRVGESATLLPTGEVLAAGGSSDAILPLSSAEIFDTSQSAWRPTASMLQARMEHTATLLRTGKVLVAGGSDGSAELSSAELFDPIAETWSSAGTMPVALSAHTATLLLDGTVLVSGRPVAAQAGTYAIYDPASGSWTSVTPMQVARRFHAAARLPDGRVLVIGGADNSGAALSTAEVFNPATRTATAAASMSVPRAHHTATLFGDGTVAVVGGLNAAGSLATAEQYTPGAGTWTPVASSLPVGTAAQSATLIPMGHLVEGGGLGPSGSLSDANRLDTTWTWNWVPSMDSPAQDEAAVVLPAGRVLTVGGQATLGAGSFPDGGGPPDAGLGPPLQTSGVFDVFCHAITQGTSMTTPRWGHTATLLPDGTVLVAGGSAKTSGPPLVAVELHRAPDTWATGAPMLQARRGHTATLLLDGRVLVAGGDTAGSTEFYDPSTASWAAGPPLYAPRVRAAAVLLPDGWVLMVGGVGPAGPLASAELWDPGTNLFHAMPPMSTPRVGHTAQLLDDGSVLVAGGTVDADGGTTASAESFDPVTRVWTPLPSMASPRSDHQAVLWLDGTVAVWGGGPPDQELYTSATHTWGTAHFQPWPYTQFNAVTLPTGEAAFTGGLDAGASAVSECWTFKTSLHYMDEMDTGTAPALYGRTGTLLPDGTVLFVGGTDGGLASAESDFFYDGRNTLSALGPTLNPLPDAWPGAPLALSGLGFSGVTEGSSGNWHASAADFPILFLYREDNAAPLAVPLSNWTATSAAGVMPLTVQPGFYWARVIVMGAPSLAQPLWVRQAPGSVCVASSQCVGGCNAGACGPAPDAGLCAGSCDAGSTPPDAGVAAAGPLQLRVGCQSAASDVAWMALASLLALGLRRRARSGGAS